MNESDFKQILQYISQDHNSDDLLQKLQSVKEQNKIFSDVYTIDADGNTLQFVELVQEGGGT